MTETAYCRECGTAISPNAADCPDCGAPQASGGDGRLSLFAAILAVVIGVFAFAIVFGPIAAVTGYDAYRKRGGWLPAAACAVGVIEALIGAWVVYLSLQGAVVV